MSDEQFAKLGWILCAILCIVILGEAVLRAQN
jgi:hypothetical protein